MKIPGLELGEGKDKPDGATLWDKTHTRCIILYYSFDELLKLVQEKINESPGKMPKM